MVTRTFLATLTTCALAGVLAGSALAASKADRFAPFGPQARNCGTVSPTPAVMNAVEQALEAYRKENRIQSLAVGGQIKVAWHVIYNGSEGNIPQSQIDAQIAELNKAYSGQHGGFNTGYTFVLASVSRTSSRKWFSMLPGSNAENQAKQALATDVTHRLNVYSAKPGQNLLGWAYFPQDYPEGNYHHGVVIHYGSVPGGYLAPYNLGGTLDHEIGHYLGLYHTFEGGCNGGDLVSDTPAEATATSGCPNGKDTCPAAGLDPIHNYMDYSDDACYTQFTAGQDSRMDAVVPVYRPHLLNAALAIAAPTEPEALTTRSATTSGLAFRGAFPNPFSRQTSLHFALPQPGRVSLKLFNVAGQVVATLVDGELSSGEQSVMLRAGTLPPGMYFAALRFGSEHVVRSVVLVP